MVVMKYVLHNIAIERVVAISLRGLKMIEIIIAVVLVLFWVIESENIHKRK
jgi:hypothetical protein